MTDEEARLNVHSLHESEPHEASSGAPFDVPADQLERIIARASVLQHAAGDVDGRRLSEEEILAIGQEVRLDPEYVRQALAEYRADSLVPPAPAEHQLLARVLGPAHARVRRVMRGQPAEIHRDFERRLRSEERMRPVRLRASESLWEPDTSLTSKITRALDFEGRGYELAQLQSVSIATAPASTDETMVTLTADLSKARREQITGWGFGLLFVTIFMLAPFIFSAPWRWMLLAPAALGGIAIAASFIHVSMNNKRRRAALVLEGLLDQLEIARR
ncbi:MAG: hypothetical protein WD397_13440 [Wenzhouxiangellaceae bacterium]